LEVDEELGTFEVAGGDADVVLCALMVEFGETPVDETELDIIMLEAVERCGARMTYLSLLVIDHHVVRFDISVHDAFAMTEVEGF